MTSECKETNKFYRSEACQQARLRKIVSANGRCEKCGAMGEDVYHIIHLTPNNVTNPNISIAQENLILLARSAIIKSTEDSRE